MTKVITGKFHYIGLGFVLSGSNFLTLCEIHQDPLQRSLYLGVWTMWKSLNHQYFLSYFSVKPCTNTQFCLEYCSCLSIFCSRQTILLITSIRIFSNKHVVFFFFIFFVFTEFIIDEINRFL